MTELMGADPGEVQALAAAMGNAASQLDRINHNTRAALHGVHWRGPDVEAIRREWDGRYGLILASAAQLLRQSHTRLIHEAQQQIDASGGGIAAGAGVVGLAALIGRKTDSAWSRFSGFTTRVITAPKHVLAALAVASMLVAKSATIGRYSNSWAKAIKHVGPVLRYKTSPLLHAVHGNKALKVMSRLGGLKYLEKAHKGLGALSTGITAGEAAQALAHRHYLKAADKSIDAGASLLKGSRNPVGYLVGVNVSLWKEVVHQASHQQLRDWTTLPANPLHGSNFRTVYLQAAKDTGVSLAHLAPGILL